jgi:hypothetical protein
MPYCDFRYKSTQCEKCDPYANAFKEQNTPSTQSYHAMWATEKMASLGIVMNIFISQNIGVDP